jgi:hypothetical protein
VATQVGSPVRLDIELREFQAASQRWARLTGKSQADVLRTAAKMTLSNPRQGSGLLQITPPASRGVTGSAARRQGERAINRDLATIFSPVRIKGKGPPPPDPVPIHRRHFTTYKRPGAKTRRDRPQPYFVDVRQYVAMRRLLFRQVGKLASGWVASARQLNASVPAWIARHGGSRGTIRMSFAAPRYFVEMTCFAPANSPWEELERRVPYALRYATNNLERQIEYRLSRDAGQSGFRRG